MVEVLLVSVVVGVSICVARYAVHVFELRRATRKQNTQSIINNDPPPYSDRDVELPRYGSTV